MNKPFLKQLLSSPGPSSFESKPAALWREQAKSYGVAPETDPYGNSYASFNKGGKPKVMLAGHIDEIGLIITHIDKDGFLYFKAIGGWDPQQLVGQRVRLVTYQNEELLGVIGKKAVHLMKEVERTKVSRIEDLWIDIGAKDEQDATAHVRAGDVGVVEQPYLELLNGRIASKALDNRLGAYLVLEIASRATKTNCEAEVIAVATVQEEITMLGARAAAYRLEPDVAIVLEVTHASDISGVNKQDAGDIALGSGVKIRIGSTVHRGVFNLLVSTAEEENIPYTIGAHPDYTNTDADEIATVKGGIPTAVVSVPIRYMHSPNEMIDLADVEHTTALVVAFCQRLERTTKFMQP
jgi:putative aminopeptidase FrvX